MIHLREHQADLCGNDKEQWGSVHLQCKYTQALEVLNISSFTNEYFSLPCRNDNFIVHSNLSLSGSVEYIVD